MAHAFDTGLASAQRTLIRDGAITLLSGLLRSNGGYLQAVIPWGGVIRSWQDDAGCDLLKTALGGRAPAVAIALGDAAFEPAGIGGFNFTAELEMVAYFVSNHQRDGEDGRLSPDVASVASNLADPGLDVMLEHVQELLVGSRCGASTTVKQIRPRREEELRTEGGETLWMQRYGITLARKINANRSVTQLLAELRTKVRTTDPAQVPPAAPNLEEQYVPPP